MAAPADWTGAAPVCCATSVDAGIFVVKTTPPVVVTIAEPEADATEEAMDWSMEFAEAVLYVVVVKLQRVRTSKTSAEGY